MYNEAMPTPKGLAAAAEMFARQLLARVASRVAEELQQPPRRLDQTGNATGSSRPQDSNYTTSSGKDSFTSAPFWLPFLSPLQFLEYLSSLGRSGGWDGRNADINK